MKTAERLHVCPDHSATEHDGSGSCCKKGRSVASIQKLNSQGLPDTHMVADLAEALLAERLAHSLSVGRELERQREVASLRAENAKLHKTLEANRTVLAGAVMAIGELSEGWIGGSDADEEERGWK